MNLRHSPAPTGTILLVPPIMFKDLDGIVNVFNGRRFAQHMDMIYIEVLNIREPMVMEESLA